MQNASSFNFLTRHATGIVSKTKSAIMDRRKAIEADVAQRRSRLLEADRVILQLGQQADRIRVARDKFVATPIGILLDRNSVLDAGATVTIGRRRRIVQELDAVLADIPAAIEYWTAKRKELSA